jgi:hypothetical protein
MSRFVMIADSDSGKVVVWDCKKQVLFCEISELAEGGWGISKVQEILVLKDTPKTDRALYELHDLLSDAANSSLKALPVPV